MWQSLALSDERRVTETFPTALSVMVGIRLRKHGRKMECSGEEGGNIGCGRDAICPAGGTQQSPLESDTAWMERKRREDVARRHTAETQFPDCLLRTKKTSTSAASTVKEWFPSLLCKRIDASAGVGSSADMPGTGGTAKSYECEDSTNSARLTVLELERELTSHNRATQKSTVYKCMSEPAKTSTETEDLYCLIRKLPSLTHINDKNPYKLHPLYPKFIICVSVGGAEEAGMAGVVSRNNAKTYCSHHSSEDARTKLVTPGPLYRHVDTVGCVKKTGYLRFSSTTIV
ncbi:hypothetical protein EK904_001634, partial [Melospiza melodia maxima]